MNEGDRNDLLRRIPQSILNQLGNENWKKEIKMWREQVFPEIKNDPEIMKRNPSEKSSSVSLGENENDDNAQND